MAKGKYIEWLKPDNLLKLSAWARDGLSDVQIAEKIGIACSTLYAWQNTYSEFSEALKKGKEVADIEVENALFKRAIGYEVDETTTEDGVITKIVRKHIQPEVGAIAFWLKNRKPKVWQDRQELAHSGRIDGANALANLSEEQLRALADAELQSRTTNSNS